MLINSLDTPLCASVLRFAISLDHIAMYTRRLVICRSPILFLLVRVAADRCVVLWQNARHRIEVTTVFSESARNVSLIESASLIDSVARGGPRRAAEPPMTGR